MPHPDLPPTVKQMTASPKMRWRHRYWHLVKNPRFVNDPANAQLVQALADIGWTAVLTGEPGSGLDFLFMHRMMINNVDQMLANANDPKWPKVVGWRDIPKTDDDADWPEPHIPGLDDQPNWPPHLALAFGAIAQARSSATKARMFSLEKQFRDPAYLTRPDTTLDVLGHEIEVTVHNWMHMRFAGMPPADFEDVDVSNDWLGRPFSSHVNPYFWKLHGWIDDCIAHWEKAREEVADFSTAWRAPQDAPPWDQLDLGAEMMGTAESAARRAVFENILPFVTPGDVVEAAVRRIEGG